ncbi:hypothetical protein PIB30_104294 [Stylosanthes scabra]|uniref:Putative plant transposon protein domain-containing protein n=1 Tax=Stylosanthes scabra TaxID=79078 RepID=A0ABU6ZXB3_9FABA|nr:hypothetical protein [Stylosanthes scabra]
MASSSSVSVFDNHCFKTAFDEELHNTIMKNKKVIAECCIDLDEDEYSEVREQIALRVWRRLSTPKQDEFYANAVVTEEEMEEAGGHTFRSFVRGVPVDFSPGNIRTVMRIRTQVQGATTDFETRKEHDQQLDQVLADLCMPGTTWKLSTVIRAILIHCIMRGENVRAEDIIADRIVRMAQGIKEKGKLGFPSTIYKLCKEAGVRQEQKEMVQEIQQIKNYQVNQTLVDSTWHKAYLEELAAIKTKQEEFFSNHINQYNMIRQDQKLLGKEILDVKKYQMSAVTIGSGSNSSPQPQRYEPNQALMKIREQHANFSEMQRQLRDWTRNASARETYTIWAHQQANPNLVEMSSQKIVKQIYDNIDHKRPMFKGLLKSDLQPSDPAPPPSSSNDPKDLPK